MTIFTRNLVENVVIFIIFKRNISVWFPKKKISLSCYIYLLFFIAYWSCHLVIIFDLFTLWLWVCCSRHAHKKLNQQANIQDNFLDDSFSLRCEMHTHSICRYVHSSRELCIDICAVSIILFDIFIRHKNSQHIYTERVAAHIAIRERYAGDLTIHRVR